MRLIALNSGGSVQVVLSRRNLEALIAKLDGYPADSAFTITKWEGATLLVVSAEENDVHYQRPEGPAGVMHPATEGRLS